MKIALNDLENRFQTEEMFRKPSRQIVGIAKVVSSKH